MTEQVFPLARDQYELLNLIGRGPFSEVYVARCHANGRLVSAKLMNIDSCEFNYPQMKKEMVFWQSATHPNMTKYYGSFKHGDTIWILAEYVNGGSVFDILQFGYKRGFKEETLIAIVLREVLNFLSYFHKRSQIHRTIQTSNILITTNGEIKVCDYGFSAGLYDASLQQNTRLIILGSACYTPPEVILGTGYAESADIWSLGIVALELALGSTPHAELTPMEQIIAIIGENAPTLPEKYSPQFRDFVSQCLQKNPSARATALDLLKHPFIRKALDSSYVEKVLMSIQPPLEQRIKVLERNEASNQRPFIGHENPVMFRFDVKDLEENGLENPENLVKTHVGKFSLTIKEPKILPIDDEMRKIEQNSENNNNESQQSNQLQQSHQQKTDDKIDFSKMSLNDIVSRVTEMEMTLATIEMDNFELNKKIGHFSQVVHELKDPAKK